jgi:NMD protein affecting ribosome stability and mRNA decay
MKKCAACGKEVDQLTGMLCSECYNANEQQCFYCKKKFKAKYPIAPGESVLCPTCATPGAKG